MNGSLAGRQFTGPSDLVNGIQAFLDEIQRSELEQVLRHWIERVRSVWITTEAASIEAE
jgi:ABC-type iron transport system FetAB ATPase subunit